MQNDKSKFKMAFGEIERNRQHFCLKYFNAAEKKMRDVGMRDQKPEYRNQRRGVVAGAGFPSPK